MSISDGDTPSESESDPERYREFHRSLTEADLDQIFGNIHSSRMPKWAFDWVQNHCNEIMMDRAHDDPPSPNRGVASAQVTDGIENTEDDQPDGDFSYLNGRVSGRRSDRGSHMSLDGVYDYEDSFKFGSIVHHDCTGMSEVFWGHKSSYLSYDGPFDNRDPSIAAKASRKSSSDLQPSSCFG
jgi:hypothetical protein